MSTFICRIRQILIELIFCFQNFYTIDKISASFSPKFLQTSVHFEKKLSVKIGI